MPSESIPWCEKLACPGELFSEDWPRKGVAFLPLALDLDFTVSAEFAVASPFTLGERVFPTRVSIPDLMTCESSKTWGIMCVSFAHWLDT